MFGRKSHFGVLALVCCLGFVLAVGTGCPRWITKGKAKVTTIFTTDSNTLKTSLLKALSGEKSVVAVDDIYSLTVSLDGITLDQEGTDDGSTDGSTSTKAKIEVYGGSQDIDLLDLEGLSTVLSSVEIPADTYTKIRLQISNPRLVLNSDTNTEITDVKLTANDNLFIGTTFTLEDGEQTLLLLDFGGIHLTINGNGRYVLTPQLRADLTLMDAAVEADGVIADLNTGDHTFTLVLSDGSGELLIDYGTTPAQIIKDDGTDGDETDLADDLTVHVTGLLQVDGSVVADTVAIQPAAP